MSEVESLLREILIEQKRTARELTTIRELTSKYVNAMAKAESEIEEETRRFVTYMHDVHDITYMY